MSIESMNLSFLGTMAGNPTYLKENRGLTYARKYVPFAGSDDLRRRLSKKGDQEFGEGYKSIGEGYSFTPRSLRDGRSFGNKPTDMQGGGFFITVKKCEDQMSILNCFAYALGTFGSQLENLTGQKISDLQDSVRMGIDSIVERYFHPIDNPEEGDLAVYSTERTLYTPTGIPVAGTTHAGIYRKSEPNWNSPKGGTIESKWGWLGNAFVFQHDPFFVPHFYGDILRFYRPNQDNF